LHKSGKQKCEWKFQPKKPAKYITQAQITNKKSLHICYNPAIDHVGKAIRNAHKSTEARIT